MIHTAAGSGPLFYFDIIICNELIVLRIDIWSSIRFDGAILAVGINNKTWSALIYTAGNTADLIIQKREISTNWNKFDSKIREPRRMLCDFLAWKLLLNKSFCYGTIAYGTICLLFTVRYVPRTPHWPLPLIMHYDSSFQTVPLFELIIGFMNHSTYD